MSIGMCALFDAYLYNKLVDIRLDVLKKHNIDIQFLLSDFINQKIEVGVNNDDLDLVLELLVEETKSDANMLEVFYLKDSALDSSLDSYGQHGDSGDPVRRSHHTKILGGLAIQRTSINTSPSCSTAFSAMQGGNYFIVTAAHCWYHTIEQGSPIYQGGNYIGVRSSKFQYGNNADAMAITVPHSRITNANFKAYNFTTVQVAGNDRIGEVICKNGLHGISCGQLQARNHSAFYEDQNMPRTWFDNMRLASYQSKGGDSGGAVYRGGMLIGVHHGSRSGLKSYSHVTNVSNRLNLTPITW